MRKLRQKFAAALSPHGFRAFVFALAPHARLLDVGCGNNSPFRVKSQRPDVYYLGLDVGDYNQTLPVLADQYIVVTADAFIGEIDKLSGTVDAIISSHNIEHCDDPPAVIRAMTSALKPGGWLYMSFPSEQSIAFPSRRGCLNFFDDPTHKHLPNFGDIQRWLQDAAFDVEFAQQRYRPPVLWLLGALLEPISRIRGHILPGTWSYFGFESVIWARKV